jgi:hydrogenase maturation protease
MSDAPVRVIGIGNPDRGDDAAGLIVARDLAARLAAGSQVMALAGDQTQLLEAWRGAPAVIVVDAMKAGLARGSLHVLDARVPLLGDVTVSNHGIGLATAIELGRALGNLPERLVILGIEGVGFERGAPMSSQVRDAVARAVDLLAEMLTNRLAATRL